MAFLPERASLDARPMPRWYTDAKLGIFVHWGLYSIPAFAERTDDDFTAFMRDLTAGKDTSGRVPYAEWYLNALRVPGSPTSRYHQATDGKDFSYFDLRTPFDAGAATVDLAEWARCFARAGARYVVMVTRHLDGYPLWPTTVTNPHMPPEYRSNRDLVGDLADAVRAQGLRMGLYYGGGLDWTSTEKPIRTMSDLMRQQALGDEYARYASAQWTELIDTYQPSILWNDMGWPAESDPHKLFAHYYDTVADGVVNDRWTQVRLPRNRLARALYLRFISVTLKALSRAGRPPPKQPPSFHHDFQTHEYALPDPAPTGPWELTRGLGRSFGTTPRRPPPTPSPAPSWSICSPMSSPTAATCSSTSARTVPAASPTSSSGRFVSSAPGWTATAKPSTRPAPGPRPRPPPPLVSRSASRRRTAPSTPSSCPATSPTASPSAA